MSARAHMVPIQGSHRSPTPQAKLLGKSDDHQRIKVSIYVRTNPHPAADSLRAVEAMNAELPGRR